MEHNDANAAAGEERPAEIDQMKLQMFMQQVRDNQNLSFAILGGAGAALLGALIWALVTAISGWQTGFMAIGIGFGVGYAVRKLGKGVDLSFSIAGATLSFLGCLLGNFLAVTMVISKQENVAFLEVLDKIDFNFAIELMVDTFSPIDILFYGFALYYGYKHSLRQLTDQEMASLART